jgi:hypothetical protein
MYAETARLHVWLQTAVRTKYTAENFDLGFWYFCELHLRLKCSSKIQFWVKVQAETLLSPFNLYYVWDNVKIVGRVA